MVEEDIKTDEQKVKKDTPKKGYISAVGRRKEAIARVRLYEDIKTGVVWADQIVKKGEIYVNQKPIDDYFTIESQRIAYKEPLKTTNTLNRYAITIKVSGGGKSGQLDAVIHGISRALQSGQPSYRPALKKKGFLTRDSRVRLRRNVGTGGKARRKKQSPKR